MYGRRRIPSNGHAHSHPTGCEFEPPRHNLRWDVAVCHRSASHRQPPMSHHSGGGTIYHHQSLSHRAADVLQELVRNVREVASWRHYDLLHQAISDCLLDRCRGCLCLRVLSASDHWCDACRREPTKELWPKEHILDQAQQQVTDMSALVPARELTCRWSELHSGADAISATVISPE